MAYTFMDDYGDEWAVGTLNPFYRHHYWVEFTHDEVDNHQVIDNECRVVDGTETYTCGRAADPGITWSWVMSRSDEETEASCFWQYDLQEAALTREYLDRAGKLDPSEDYDVFMGKWRVYRDSVWIKFFENYPEHPHRSDFLEDVEERKAYGDYYAAV